MQWMDAVDASRCGWRAGSGSERGAGLGKMFSQFGPRRLEARRRQGSPDGTCRRVALFEFLGRIGAWLEILSPGEGCAKGLGTRWRKTKRGPEGQNCRPLVQGMRSNDVSWHARGGLEHDLRTTRHGRRGRLSLPRCGRETTALLQDAIANAGYLHAASFEHQNTSTRAGRELRTVRPECRSQRRWRALSWYLGLTLPQVVLAHRK